MRLRSTRSISADVGDDERQIGPCIERRTVDTFASRGELEILHHVLQEIAERERFRMNDDLTGIELREIEQPARRGRSTARSA